MKSTVDRPLGLRTLKRNSEPLRASSPLLPCVWTFWSQRFFLFQRHQKSHLASLVLVVTCPLFNAVGVGKCFSGPVVWGLGLTQPGLRAVALGSWLSSSCLSSSTGNVSLIVSTVGPYRAQVYASLCFMVARLYLRANFYISLHVPGNSDFQRFQ